VAGGWGLNLRCRLPQASTVNIRPGHRESYWLALSVARPQITMVTFVPRLIPGGRCTITAGTVALQGWRTQAADRAVPRCTASVTLMPFSAILTTCSKEVHMAQKVIEIVGASKDSFAKAAENAVSEAAKTVRGMKWARVAEFEMKLDGKKITEYRVTARIYFEIER
jgi:dodecin